MLIWVVPGTAPSGGMDFKVLNWKRRQRRCRRMRNKLSGERDGDDNDFNLGGIDSERVKMTCLSLKNLHLGQ